MSVTYPSGTLPSGYSPDWLHAKIRDRADLLPDAVFLGVVSGPDSVVVQTVNEPTQEEREVLDLLVEPHQYYTSYTYSVRTCDSGCLVRRINDVPELLAKLDRVAMGSVSVDAWFTSSLTQEESDLLNGVLAAVALSRTKYLKMAEIDNRTQELIAQGFAFKSKTLSLSGNAQRYYLGMMVGASFLTYPFAVNALDDLDGTVSIESIDEVQACYAAAVGTIASRLGGGTALKDQVRAATTVSEVEAVEDNR